VPCCCCCCCCCQPLTGPGAPAALAFALALACVCAGAGAGCRRDRVSIAPVDPPSASNMLEEPPTLLPVVVAGWLLPVVAGCR
jgi:hypothetical protein